MKYTQRLKLSITADMIFIATLVVSALLIVKEKITMNNLGLNIDIFLIVGGACLAATLYKERGECRKWRNIWKLPIWQTVGYFLLAGVLLVSIWSVPESISITDILIGILIMGNALISDIRYYRNAVRFGMDDLNGVNELANKYPEARPMINRKKKTDKEKE
jgi:hypothetical protein